MFLHKQNLGQALKCKVLFLFFLRHNPKKHGREWSNQTNIGRTLYISLWQLAPWGNGVQSLENSGKHMSMQRHRGHQG